MVGLTVQPVSAGPDTAAVPTFYLVSFENAPAADPQQPEKAADPSADKAAGAATGEAGVSATDAEVHIRALQQELRAKEEYLQTSNEELATSNEELKSSNEEMQSVNEELQSTNEELETSKEELQSVNEELATVNAELQNKVADLSRSNNDMNNLLAGTGIGTIFVDHHLRIQRFTPAVTQVINLILTDVGRPVGHIVSNLTGYDRLVSDVRAVLDTLAPREVEVQTQAGAWYLLHIRPYRTLENVIEGAVITFTEITEMKKAQDALREAEALRRLAMIVRDARDAITMQDFEGRILTWNPAAERMYGWSEAEALQMNIRDLIPEGRRKEVLAQLRQQSRPEVVEPYRMQRIAKDGRIVEVAVTATVLVNESGEAYAVATTERGID
jgi:two-component system CheB/CheR fusion protein